MPKSSMSESEVVSYIKGKEWDVRVSRIGFLQSKAICIAAEVLPIELTPKTTVQFFDECWVGDLNLYDDKACKGFLPFFEKAFKEDSNWPLMIIKRFEEITKIKNNLIKELASKKKRSVEEKKKLVKEYEATLLSFQKYYAIAVTFGNFCEDKIKVLGGESVLATNSVPFAKLDIDEYHFSIAALKKKTSLEAKKAHLEKFAWIKTSYNVIEPYTLKELDTELKSGKEVTKQPKVSVPKNLIPYVQGLQVSIFMRNRMKELGQQVWFAFEGLAQELAKDLKLKREDFYQLLIDEVISSLDAKKSVVLGKEIEERKKGFINCQLKAKEVLLTGKVVKELVDYYSPKSEGETFVKGSVACKGNIKGIAQIILSPKELSSFKEGNILITNMTTPDFVIALKKASGIITNEGGVTCHAAIISRELNIPCIIGTKNATTVFKNGDLIEMDSDKGIVRKI
jgi:phosphohistidine swiveling domain-containing protein